MNLTLTGFELGRSDPDRTNFATEDDGQRCQQEVKTSDRPRRAPGNDCGQRVGGKVRKHVLGFYEKEICKNFLKKKN